MAIKIIIILWVIREIKIALFYLYLWQLKEYHVKRFIEHWRTEKGKRLIFHPFKIAKFLLCPVLAPPTDFLTLKLWIVLFFYLSEITLFMRQLIKRQVKKPVLTAKTVFLGLVLLLTILAGASLFKNTLLPLVLADFFSPLIFSAIILVFQPLAAGYRLITIARARKKRQSLKNLKVIGITGSYGKTSTKEFLKTVLEQKFKVLATKEHQNSEIAIAKCILNDLKPEHEVFICEMGAYDKGKVKQVASMARPNIGIVTGVNEQHLALFGSMEKLVSGEGGGELAESLPENETIIINQDGVKSQISNLKSQIQISNLKTIYCSLKEKLDIWAENIVVEKEKLSFAICDKTGERADSKVNLVGRQNIENILLAAACAKELGMFLAEIAAACEKITPDQGPIKLVRSPASHKTDILDSTYSANPDGVLAALEHLKLWSGKKIIVMPCLIELGPAAKQVHQRIGRKIGEICDLAIITTKDWFEEIKKSAIEAGMKPENTIFSEDKERIITALKPFLKLESVILLQGRGPINSSDLQYAS